MNELLSPAFILFPCNCCDVAPPTLYFAGTQCTTPTPLALDSSYDDPRVGHPTYSLRRRALRRGSPRTPPAPVGPCRPLSQGARTSLGPGDTKRGQASDESFMDESFMMGTSDCKHQPAHVIASDKHGHNVEHSTRRVRGTGRRGDGGAGTK